MGACASRGPCLSAEAAAALKRSRAIEAENEDHFRAERAKIKLLLLGAGESGKSTIFKQIRLLYGAPLTEEDQVTMTSCVHANVLEASKALCEAAAERGTADDVKDAAAFGMVAAVADSAAVSAERSKGLTRHIGHCVKHICNLLCDAIKGCMGNVG